MRKTCFFALALGFYSLSLHAETVDSIQVAGVVSENFIKEVGSYEKAEMLFNAQIQDLNLSLSRQNVESEVNIRGITRTDLGGDEVNPREVCMTFEGDEHWGIDANPDLAEFTKTRIRFEADVVILLINSKDPQLKQSQSYGIACRSNPRGDEGDEDPSFLIVDKLGLQTYTLLHEFGHFLGIDSHHYSKIAGNHATLMIANGNPENLTRKPYWSDNDFVLNGIPLSPLEGLSDIQIIKNNLKKSTSAFETWLRRLNP